MRHMRNSFSLSLSHTHTHTQTHIHVHSLYLFPMASFFSCKNLALFQVERTLHQDNTTILHENVVLKKKFFRKWKFFFLAQKTNLRTSWTLFFVPPKMVMNLWISVMSVFYDDRFFSPSFVVIPLKHKMKALT